MKILLNKSVILKIYLILLSLFFILGLIFVTYINKIVSNLSITVFLHMLIIAAPFFCAIFIINFLKNTKTDVYNSHQILKHFNYQRNLVYIFIFAYIILIFLNVLGYENQIFYAALITFLFLIIFFQILITNINSMVVVGELMFTFMCSIYAISFKSPNFFGNSDLFLHIDWASIIATTGKILPSDISGLYINYPVVHILTVTASSIFDISLLNAYYFLMGAIWALTILFLFCLFKLFVGEKIALLACLFFSTTGIVICGGITFIPYHMYFVFFLLFLFLLLKFNISNKNILQYIILIILTTAALIFTHHGSILYLLIILTIFYSCCLIYEILYHEKLKFNPFPIIILFAGFLIHWFYFAWSTSKNLEENAVNFFIDNEYLGKSILTSKSVHVDETFVQELTKFLLNNFTSSILLFFILVGIGFAIIQKNNKYLYIFSFFALISLVFWSPFGLNFLNLFQKFGFLRMILFLMPFTMILFAFGFFNIYIHPFKTSQKYVILILALIFVAYSFFQISSMPYYQTSLESQDWTNRQYLNNEDLVSISFFDTMTANNANVVMDNSIIRYFEARQYSPTIASIGWHYYQLISPNFFNLNNVNDKYILFRNFYFENTENSMFQPILSQDDEFIYSAKLSSHFNKIFTTGKNKIFSDIN